MILLLKRFLTVVDRASITQAAKNLYLTQPAMSLSIKRLEKELGVKLFNRIGKNLVLTEDGQAVYGIGSRIVKLWEKARNKEERQKTGAKTYSIGVFDNAALKLSKFFQNHFISGDFRLEITIERSSQLLLGMRNGLYDLCICVIPQDRDFGRNILLESKFSETLFPVVGRKMRKNDLSAIPFILYNKESSTRHYIDRTFFKHGISPNIIVESTSPEFMKELAIGGCGIALLPKNFVERELTQKKLFVRKFPFIFKREIGLFLNKEGDIKDSDGIVREIIKLLQ